MRTPRTTIVALTALGVLVLAACGSDSNSSSTTVATPTTAAAAATPTTAASGSATTAAAGSTLKLVDADDEPHTVTANDGSFDSVPFSPNKPTTLTVPTAPGTYAFHCKIHPTMHGTLVVQ